MPRMLVVLVAVMLVIGRPSPGRAHAPAEEFGLAVGAAAANLIYTPAKLTMAVAGLAVGGLTGLLNGGDVRSAYAVWVPTASGTFMLPPSHLDGSVPVAFFGCEYTDRPSPAGSVGEAGGIYEAQYSR
jgi:hypothetical protein